MGRWARAVGARWLAGWAVCLRLRSYLGSLPLQGSLLPISAEVPGEFLDSTDLLAIRWW